MSGVKVQVTVVVTPKNGIARVESTTLQVEDPERVVGGVGRVIGDTARILGERAVFGRQLPTPAREGGRGA